MQKVVLTVMPFCSPGCNENKSAQEIEDKESDIDSTYAEDRHVDVCCSDFTVAAVY